MQRDFDQLVFDARHWLSYTRPRFAIRNELGMPGLIKRQRTMLDDPREIIAALEVRQPFNRSRFVGAIALSVTDDDALNDPAVLHWDSEGVVTVLSPLTYTNGYVALSRLSGSVLDRVYERFAPPMEQVLLDIAATVR